MTDSIQILDTIDAIAGHQRTGNGRETIRNLTAELRGFFTTSDEPSDVTESEAPPVEAPPIPGWDIGEEVAFAQDITERELQYAEAETAGEESFKQDVADAEAPGQEDQSGAVATQEAANDDE